MENKVTVTVTIKLDESLHERAKNKIGKIRPRSSFQEIGESLFAEWVDGKRQVDPSPPHRGETEQLHLVLSKGPKEAVQAIKYLLEEAAEKIKANQQITVHRAGGKSK
jgi:hypothetical protein